MPESQPRRRTCLTVVILGSPTILSVLIFVAFWAWMLGGQKPIRDLFWGEPATEYSEEVVRIREEVEAELEAARNRLEHDLANLPPECPLPEGWRLETMLENAWLPVESESIRDLMWGAWSAWDGEDIASIDSLDKVSERLAMARRAGKITALEDRLDPNVHGREEALRRFREYVIEAEYLDQLEAGIDFGVARYVQAKPLDLKDGALDRLPMAANMLRLRVLHALESGDMDAASATCYRLHRLAEADVNPYTWRWSRVPLITYADLSLALVMSYGEISQHWQKKLLEHYDRRFEGEVIHRMMERAVIEADKYDFHPSLSTNALAASLLKAIYDAEEMLQPPLIKHSNDIRALLEEYGIDRPRESEDEEYLGLWALFTSFWNPSRDSLAGIELRSILADAVEEIQLRFRTDVARTAFALHNYHAEHGIYPENLDALVPKHLQQLPAEPVFGEPLKYTPSGDGYELSARSLPYRFWDMPVEDESPRIETLWRVQASLFSRETP